MQVAHEDSYGYHDALQRQEQANEREHTEKALALEAHSGSCIGKHGGEYNNENYYRCGNFDAVEEVSRQIECVPCLCIVFYPEHSRRTKWVSCKYLKVVLKGIEQHPY